MRSCEVKGLQWRDVDFLERTVTVRHSKTDAGKRVIPLNDEAWQAILTLYHRAQKVEGTEPRHYVFPACENGHIDPAKPQKSWRSAWRSLRKAASLAGFRFHDLRHHAITELVESGASDQTILAIAGHVSQEMLEHYSHIRLQAKRRAVEVLSQKGKSGGHVTNHVTNEVIEGPEETVSQRKDWSGREDLNLRPPGPEQENSKIQVLHLVSLRNQKAILSFPQLDRSCTEFHHFIRLKCCRDLASSLTAPPIQSSRRPLSRCPACIGHHWDHLHSFAPQNPVPFRSDVPAICDFGSKPTVSRVFSSLDRRAVESTS
jgi:hypothetical protein